MKKTLISTNMKIFLLILLVLSIIFYASGCIVLANSGYKLSDYADELNIAAHNFTSYFNNEGIKFGLNFNESVTSSEQSLNEGIDSIEFNLTSQHVQLKNYDGDVIKIQIKSNVVLNSAKLPAVESDNKLIFSSTPDTPNNATISISIPSSFNSKGDIKVTTSNGDIDVSNLSLKSFTLSTASGDVYMSNSNFNYLSINTSVSDVDLNNVNNKEETKINSTSGYIRFIGNPSVLNCNTSSSDIDIQVKDILNNTSLSTLSGDISLSLPENCGYKINYNTISGDFNPPSTGLSFGDESSIINLRSASGDMNIY